MIPILLTTALLLLSLWLIGRRSAKLKWPLLALAFTIKIVAGIIFIEIYTHHYGNGTLSADAEQFLREGKVLNDVFSESKMDYVRLFFGLDNDGALADKYLDATHHWDSNSQLLLNDNRNQMRIHSLIHFISGGELYVHVLFFNFFSLISILLLTKVVQQYTRLDERILFFILLLLPSVLFWTSSVLKEPVLFLGFCALLYALLVENSWFKRILFLVLGSSLVLAFKPYILVGIVPAVLIYWSYKKLDTKWFYLQGVLISLIAILVLNYSSIGTSVTESLSRKQFDFINISQGGIHLMADDCFYYLPPESIADQKIMNDTVYFDHAVKLQQFDYGYNYIPRFKSIPAGSSFPIYFRQEPSKSYIHVERINNDPIQLILNIPSALINTLFRPFPTDNGSWLILPAIIETLLLWVFLIIGMFRVKKLPKEHKAFIWGLITFIILLSLLIGWVTPVLGAINRYRTPIIIALVIIGLINWFPKHNFNEKNSSN